MELDRANTPAEQNREPRGKTPKMWYFIEDSFQNNERGWISKHELQIRSTCEKQQY